MQTHNTSHLGDGAYVGADSNDPGQLWLGANHHEAMTVALDARALQTLALWCKQYMPQMAAAIKEGLEE